LITISWNVEKYKNKNFEKFPDVTIIFITILTIYRGTTDLRKITQPTLDYLVKIAMPPMNYITTVMKSGRKSIF
jgi:hypothetical protein